MHRIFRDRMLRKLKKKEEHENEYELTIEKKLNKLRSIIECVEPKFNRNLPGHQWLPLGFLGRKLDGEELRVDCDEVYKNIFVGDRNAAKNKHFLKMMGITHVLNAADGTKLYTQVQTGAHYYTDVNIKYMGLNVLDMPQAKISIHFMEASDFIEKALNSGKILVHCMMGFSRSATIVIAYLMIKKHMSLEDALITLRQKRQVCPNEGFLRQLIDLSYRV